MKDSEQRKAVQWPKLMVRTVASWMALLGMMAGTAPSSCGEQASVNLAKPSHGVSYHHQEISEGPWSVHIVKLDRANHDFEIHSTLGGGRTLGIATLSEQIRSVPVEIGKPVAGVNGDFYKRDTPYLGDPKGLQIMRGELVSAPCDWSCFWVDAGGNPHITNVVGRFQVTWPTGEKTPFGLNEERFRNTAVLYTSTAGYSTETSGGREIVLERVDSNPWLPLKAGVTLSARVREVRNGGNTPIKAGTMVLSLGRSLMGNVPAVKPGTLLQISTATWPDLKDAPTAVGGGPAIVRNGKVIEHDSSWVRHPRVALGWNKDFFYLAEVDGRQRSLSVGMTMREWSEFMVKLGCTDAMNLDGGGSATCWVYGQVMNSPSEGQERGMGNCLVIVQKERN